jgi:protein SCO1/2
MKKFQLIIWGTSAITAALLALFLAYQHLVPAPPVASQIGGPFRLVSSNGGVVDSADLAGKPYGVFFGFTHCPEVCPTTLYEMSSALKELGDGAEEFRLFFITVDPERDTPAFIKDYLANFDPRIEGLVPALDQLPQVAKKFRAFYEKVPTSDGEYTMNHTATVYLMDRQGRLASTLGFNETKEMRMTKLRKVVGSG